MSKLILYDLPSKGRCTCWSLNPWKIRMALNFKGLDYQTDWIEYPDIVNRLSPHVPPNPPDDSPGYTKYSIPAMQFPDGSYVMESKSIAARLEKEHPTPSMHLDSPLIEKVEKLIPPVAKALIGELMPKVPTNVLNPTSKEYFERTRAERLGKPLDEFGKAMGGEEAWENAKPELKALGEAVEENGGPFVMGSTPSYADFVVVGLLQFYKVIDEKMFQRVVEIEPVLGKLYDASKPWLERDGH
ncbi:Glutathione S-transferase-like protein [Lachnellula suecica]|uniref:Glutathione S-transferase-like protein n=1 Tax=Lachnellula suecica TaxID=602035 RepID=A0A8T9CH55_9HELO|nr:Glutathione S-transferase-like protein [Lachnellula suecica]